MIENAGAIIGIDPSFVACGVAKKSTGRRVTFIHCKTIKTTPKDGTRIDRILKIWGHLRATIGRSDIVYMEDYAYSVGRSATSQLAQLGELCGVLNLLVKRWTGHEVVKVTPGQWKKFLSGNGNLKKDEFMLKVYKKFGIETDTNDAAVAVAICDLGAHIEQGEHCRELTKYEFDILKKIKSS